MICKVIICSMKFNFKASSAIGWSYDLSQELPLNLSLVGLRVGISASQHTGRTNSPQEAVFCSFDKYYQIQSMYQACARPWDRMLSKTILHTGAPGRSKHRRRHLNKTKYTEVLQVGPGSQDSIQGEPQGGSKGQRRQFSWQKGQEIP